MSAEISFNLLKISDFRFQKTHELKKREKTNIHLKILCDPLKLRGLAIKSFPARTIAMQKHTKDTILFIYQVSDS